MLTKQQLEARKGLVTSSVAAGALGINPLMSPIQAWCRIRGEDDGTIGSKAMERGNLLEPVVLEYPCHVMDGLRYEPAPFRRHPTLTWAADSCDALYYRGDTLSYIGEGKTAGGRIADRYLEEGTDEIPESTLIQCHWHLIHWPEVETCLVPVLVGGWQMEFRLYRVERDESLEGAIIDDLGKFWRDHVATGKPPQATSRDTDWIKQRLTEVMAGKYLEDTPEVQQLAWEAAEAKALKREAEEREKEACNKLRMMLGDAEGVIAHWGKVTWKANKPSIKQDWKSIALALGADKPENVGIIADHTREVPGARTLRITVNKG